MGVREGGADVHAELGGVAVAELAAFSQLGQRRALDQLADQERPPVRRAELVQGDHPGVVQASGRLRLPQYPSGVGAGDLLHRDLALQALVERPVDRPHAARAHPIEDPEAFHNELAHHSGPTSPPALPDPPGAATLRAPARPPSGSAAPGVILSALNAVTAFTHGRSRLAFLDEEELAPPGGRGPSGGRGRDHQRQIMVRRAVGVGVVVLLLILLVLGIRGCLNARKERGFENYVRDLNAIAAQIEAALGGLLQPSQRPGQPDRP